MKCPLVKNRIKMFLQISYKRKKNITIYRSVLFIIPDNRSRVRNNMAIYKSWSSYPCKQKGFVVAAVTSSAV